MRYEKSGKCQGEYLQQGYMPLGQSSEFCNMVHRKLNGPNLAAERLGTRCTASGVPGEHKRDCPWLENRLGPAVLLKGKLSKSGMRCKRVENESAHISGSAASTRAFALIWPGQPLSATAFREVPSWITALS